MKRFALLALLAIPTLAAQARVAMVMLNDTDKKILLASLESVGATQWRRDGEWWTCQVEQVKYTASPNPQTFDCVFYGLTVGAHTAATKVPAAYSGPLTRLLKESGVPVRDGFFTASPDCSARIEHDFFEERVLPFACELYFNPDL